MRLTLPPIENSPLYVQQCFAQLIFTSLCLCLCLCLGLGFSSLLARIIHWRLPTTKCVICFQFLATVGWLNSTWDILLLAKKKEAVRGREAPVFAGSECSNLSRGGRLTADTRWTAARNCHCWELPRLPHPPHPPLSCLSPFQPKFVKTETTG